MALNFEFYDFILLSYLLWKPSTAVAWTIVSSLDHKNDIMFRERRKNIPNIIIIYVKSFWNTELDITFGLYSNIFSPSSLTASFCYITQSFP